MPRGCLMGRAGVCAPGTHGPRVPCGDSSGGGYRSGMATIGATKGETLYLQNSSSTALAKGGRGTIEVYPMPAD